MIRLDRDKMKARYEDLTPSEAATNPGMRRALVLTVPVEHPELGSTTYPLRVDAGKLVDGGTLYELAMDALREHSRNGTIELATAKHWTDAFLGRTEPTSPETASWIDALNARVTEVEPTSPETASWIDALNARVTEVETARREAEEQAAAEAEPAA